MENWICVLWRMVRRPKSTVCCYLGSYKHWSNWKNTNAVKTAASWGSEADKIQTTQILKWKWVSVLVFSRSLCKMPWPMLRDAWLDWKLKVEGLGFAVHSHVTGRNCSWTTDQCIRHLLSLVRHEADHQMISVTFEKALDADFIQAVAHGTHLVYFEYLKVDFKQDCIFFVCFGDLKMSWFYL